MCLERSGFIFYKYLKEFIEFDIKLSDFQIGFTTGFNPKTAN